MSDLTPCPFCGSTDLDVHPKNADQTAACVVCRQCAAQGPTVQATEDLTVGAAAATSWNQRGEA